LVLEGLAEFREALRRLPEQLRAEGAEIVGDAAELTKASLIQAYPLGDTGKLRAGVRLVKAFTDYGAVAIVKSTAKHASIWEFGTAVRSTRQGWNRGVSPSHAAEGLIPIAMRNRKHMYAQLGALLQRAGFEVHGVV
jgi:hypothetical protein